MDIDRAIISCLLRDGIQELRKASITSDMLQDESRKAFDWILEFFAQYGKMPDKQTIESIFGEGFVIDAPEPFSFYAKFIKERHLMNILSDGIDTALTQLQELNPQGVRQIISDLNLEVAEFLRQEQDFVDLRDTTQRRLERYRQIKATGGILIGYETPWPSLNEVTGGLNPGDLWVVLAPPNTGKTFCTLYFASHLWKLGVKVLFVTMEMSVARVETRFDAMIFKLPYNHLRKGLLTTEGEALYAKGLSEMAASDTPIWFAGRHTVRTPADVAILIEEFHPQVVIIDAMYRMFPSDSRTKYDRLWDKVRNVVDELGALAISKNVPILVSSQLNRTHKKGSLRADYSEVGKSYEIVEDCDVAIALLRDASMEEQNFMILSVIKNRDGRRINIDTNWNIDNNDFSEIGARDFEETMFEKKDEQQKKKKKSGPESEIINF